MKKKCVCILALMTVLAWNSKLVAAANENETFDPVEYVNPLMGTQSSFELSTGNTYPAIARPWGMNFWTPQTGKMGDGWQYVYTANKIRGFKQTHQPSPWINDYGQFAIMPVVGKPEFDQDKRASWFSHKGEIAKPYYYKVYLAEHDVVTEFTPTDRAALFRFTFPESDNSYIVVDALDKGSYIKVIPEENKIIGYSTKNSGGVPDNFKNYFIIEFDKPFTYEATFADATLKEGAKEQTSDHVGSVIGFKTKKGEVVHARIASSFIGFDQAAVNMKELGNDSFETLVNKGKNAWNDVLGRIEVEGGSLDQFRTFYSCMYRSLLFPRKFYEIDAAGKVVHYSPYNGEVLPGYMFTDTGFWDTFRCLFPFLNLMYPSMNKEMQEGLINVYKESGFFPEWASPGHRGCMVGNNSASILVDAYMKGVKVDDLETLYKGLIHGTENVHPTVSSTGRLGHEYYNKLGYVPYDVKINENAARTLEYAYNDWCIWKIAKDLGRPKKELELYARRALNYKNLYDKESMLMRGKNENGEFMAPFSPLKWGDAFTEGNSWHYSWSVFHDPQGLIDLMGGKENFVMMLDSVFAVPPLFDDSYYGQVIHEIREMTVMNMGNYAHGNQPIQHMIYMYNYAGQPWKAQYWLRQVMDRMYTPGPDGYCGDEDNGQTSAWYVFTALGFYPVAPGTTQYVLGAPLFKKATLHFENGNNLVINAPDNSAKNIYIESMTFNGKNYTKNYLDHNDLFKGGVIDYKMGDKPNYNRGINPEDMPYSFSVNEEGISKLSPITAPKSKKKK
ncbi:GH92 family glycosyl hydrolase [Parabacteroides bouchesdurhonensis]|uniref:GH92 family glycosyl hydrolase n=1 Tax=Parabacteroides bouchesdurhonensis TaxID=1936995 RepID=UPI000E48895D|nr:GH92 family glycosyl hydrolase [Parabacteroides bouchesdurhonensis]RHJ90690.1 glycoside hydrolase family 92 protein [Bacteroides sp. AM07-16]